MGESPENAAYQILKIDTAKILLEHTNDERLRDHPISDCGWMKQVGLRAHTLVESGDGKSKDLVREQLYRIGVAALDAFLQSNVTGPPLTWDSAGLLFPSDVARDVQELRAVRRNLVQDLSVDGEAVYKLIPNVELFCLAKIILNLPALIGQNAIPRYRWARVAVNSWHQRLLNENAPSLQETIYEDLDALKEDLRRQNPEEKARRLVQRATIHTQHGFDQKAREDLARATEETGFDFKLTGRLGKRTKYQEKDFSQLVVLAKSADTVKNSSATQSSDHTNGIGSQRSDNVKATYKPQNLDLNDDTLLESIAFAKSVLEPSLDNERDISPSLAALDPANQPTLRPLDSIILLAYASSITNTSPADGLTREETLPYALRVLQDGSLNWQIYTQALLVRSRIEGYRSRTVERSVLQLQALVDQVIVETTSQNFNDRSDGPNEESAPSTFFPKPKPSESASAAERLEYLPQLASPTRWELEAELASRWVSLGGLRTALEIYERLQMWAEVALCWAANDREDKAIKIIRRQLYTSSSSNTNTSNTKPTIDDNDDDISIDSLTTEGNPLPPDAPRLFCILGDLEKSPSAYNRAWEISNHRYARAQRSLGKHHFSLGDLRKADEAYAKSLKVSPQSHSTWFSLGCVRLQLEDWPGAVEAFRRAIQIDDKDAESWSNLAAALVQMDPGVIHLNSAEEKTGAMVVAEDDDDEEDVTAANTRRLDPQQHIKEAFTALKRAAALKRDSYRIWQNLLNVSVKLSPPPYTDLIVAQTRLIDLRGKSEGEKCVDVEFMEGLVAHLIATSPSPPAAAPSEQGIGERT
ncbi:MAG: hypothetical protein LQ338_004752, partial [Usnochroma carphineum]